MSRNSNTLGTQIIVKLIALMLVSTRIADRHNGTSAALGQVGVSAGPRPQSRISLSQLEEPDPDPGIANVAIVGQRNCWQLGSTWH
jgi:hypothetical protein